MITMGLVLNAKSMTLQTQVAGVMMRETLTFRKHVVLMRSVTRLKRLLDFMEDGVLSVIKVAMLHWSQSLYLLLISLMVCPLFCLLMAQEEIYLWKMLEMDIVSMQLMGVVKGRGEERPLTMVMINRMGRKTEGPVRTLRPTGITQSQRMGTAKEEDVEVEKGADGGEDMGLCGYWTPF